MNYWIYDGYNDKIHTETGIMGTVVPQFIRWGLTNGYKIFEILYLEDE